MERQEGTQPGVSAQDPVIKGPVHIFCTLFFFFGDLANHHITSKLIQLFQFEQLFIKCSTQKKQTSSTSKYIKFQEGEDLIKQVCPPILGSQLVKILQRGSHLKTWKYHHLLSFAHFLL